MSCALFVVMLIGVFAGKNCAFSYVLFLRLVLSHKSC